MARFCPNCGTPLDEGAVFCGACGTRMESQPEPQYAQPTPPPQPQYTQQQYAQPQQQYAQPQYQAQQQYAQPQPQYQQAQQQYAQPQYQQPQYQYAQPQPQYQQAQPQYAQPQPQYQQAQPQYAQPQQAPQHRKEDEDADKKSKISKKAYASLTMWTSLLLAALILVMSFMPIITLDTSKASASMGDFVNVAIIDVPDEIDVSFAKIIGSFELMGDLLKVGFMEDKMSDEDYEISAEELEEYYELQEELEESMNSKEGAEHAFIAAAMVSSIETIADSDFPTHALLIIYEIITVILSLAFACFFVLILPITAVVMFLKVLIPTLINAKKPGLGASKVASRIPQMLSIPFSTMLLVSLIPGISLAWGVTAICVIIGIFVLMCTVLTRLRSYAPKKFTYLNIVQGVSLVSLIGFIVFFLNILKTNVIPNFLGGNMVFQLMGIALGDAASKEFDVPFDPNGSYIIDLVLIFLFAMAVISATKYVGFLASRLSCTINPKKRLEENNVDSGLVTSIWLLITFIAPKIVAGCKHYYYDIESTASKGDESFLILSSSESSALTVALIGIIIMIAAEIVLKVLKKKLCKELSTYDTNAIVCGLEQTKEYIK